MMDLATLGKPYTKGNEGCRLSAYADTLGVTTIGYGHAHVAPGTIWTQAQCDAAFDVDYAHALGDAENCVSLACWLAMGIARQAVLVDQAFQLGYRGLREFVSMRAALEDGRWADAAEDALASLAAKETPTRWARHAQILRLGDAAIIDGMLPA